MKKISILLLVMLLMSGCSSKQKESTFMLENDQLYRLYNQNGEELSDNTFQSYDEMNKVGYVVTSQNKVGFISYRGKEIIEMGKYASLDICQNMLYASQKNKQDSKEEIKYVNEDLLILDQKGEILYQADKKTSIKPDVLPIIKQGQTYVVLYDDGKELYKGNEEVLYVREKRGKYICIGFKDHMKFYYRTDDEKKDFELDIKTKNQYDIVAYQDQAVVLNDIKHQDLYYIDIENKKNYYIDLPVSTVYFDDNGNVILKSKNQTYIYLPGSSPKIINSYYYSSDTYVIRKDVYGPHQIFKQGKEKELKDCQLYPIVQEIHSEIFPVYVLDQGYVYYNFDGQKVIDKAYIDAQPFDINNRAIVKDKDEGYILIDEKGNSLTEESYYQIKYIGSSYYAVYNKIGVFGIIDADGKEVFPMEYTSLPEEAIVEYQDHEYLLLGKNGRYYVYDVKQDMKEICSSEGEIVFNAKGYFACDDTYYTLEGKQIK